MPRLPTVLLLTTWAITLSSPSEAQPRTVTGQTGILAEWDLTATVMEQGSSAGRQWIGPLSLKHVGFCGTEGPEERTGELRLRVSDPPSQATATLLIGGEICTFSGKFKDGYDGVMTCPDRRAVPMFLLLE